jgi:hypothetical protein
LESLGSNLSKSFSSFSWCFVAHLIWLYFNWFP